MRINSSITVAFNKIIQKKERLAKKPAILLSFILLFTISATYLYYFGNGIFFYQENKILFIFSKEYFQKFAILPGGLLTYFANFLTQGYFNYLYGSLIISIILMLTCYVFIKISKRLTADKSFSLPFVLFPSLLLLLLHTYYNWHIQYSLGYLFVSFWFLVSIIQKKTYFKFVILLLFPLLYYLLGSFVWMYLGMYSIFSFIYTKGMVKLYLSTSLIAVAILTFIIFKEFLFLQPIHRLLGYPIDFDASSNYSTWFFLLGGLTILFPLFIKTHSLININIKARHIIQIITIITVFPIVVLLLFERYNPQFTNLMQIEKAVYNQNWDTVIKQHESSPSDNVIGLYYYNLALSEKGQLCNRLFFGNQKFGSMPLTLPRNKEQAFRAVYFFYTIGLINEAHHLAYELMVQNGYVPQNIKLLIKTDIINGNYKIAERYINVLKRTLHYGSWANKYEKMLFNNTLINADYELGKKLSLIPKNDFFLTPNDEQTIEFCFKENSDNRILFEYRIAKMMLEKDIYRVVSEVKEMKRMGYTTIPRHIEEVIITYINLTQKSPDLGGLSISTDTKRRFKQYRLASNSYKGNKSLVEKEMKKEYKNTFWYYLQFTVVSSKFQKKHSKV